MKYIILALSLITGSVFAQDLPLLPSKISSQIPTGWTVKDVIKGQLNKDNELDYVVVVENEKFRTHQGN